MSKTNAPKIPRTKVVVHLPTSLDIAIEVAAAKRGLSKRQIMEEACLKHPGVRKELNSSSASAA